MKKTILAIIVILVIAVAGAIFYVFSNLDALVKIAIEEYGSEAIQTSVQVDEVAIKLTEGSAAINGLNVANPDGFSLPQAFSLGQIAVDINLEKTGNELIAIDAIKIAAPRVFYEINADRKGSLNILKDNLGSGGGASAGTSAGAESPTGAESAPFMLDIARFEFKDASLHAKVVPLNDKTYDLKLPMLVLTDLSGTPEQISRQILDRLIDHAKKEVQKQGLDKELAEIKARAQQRIDEEKAELEQKADERVEEEKQKAEDKLKNLLSR
jgi:hypothetical protein